MKVKIGLAQFQPVLYDKEANLEKMIQFIKEASEQGCDIVLFPEMATTGYFTREKTAELAEEAGGKSIQILKQSARERGVIVIAGFPEKKDGQLFNSAAIIDQDGVLLGTYQKVHLWDEEYKYFSAGSSFPVWNTEFGTIGVMICYDTEFPETARSLADKGAEMILAPTANMKPLEHFQNIYIQSRAAENQVFVATTNRIGVEETTHFFGESAAASPFGKLLVKGSGDEQLYITELDLAQIEEARSSFFYLKDRRPDLYIPEAAGRERL
ncbi:carbon-nitrogen hydrolase family protein [Domibacillus indicus]|uniref:carbon-nitrogen hydrolase family protein n=1 Tax=Domibacillus indicus TaxID=1437523 RepID=UPI00203CBEAD|nr:carbon-nitrogen hydrolase family protein [Domibacillus indicus]MCM3791103.1 carbon-nitrogen hydrolase family protein [Domibacillus indicus]